ncbi:MAG TPA: T9SS type A sorting domain-containing protein, partial [Flavobacteriales bacterium]|nr:T9SS type A sorting domain-containing protein [Flavobacteriales bacterium]
PQLAISDAGDVWLAHVASHSIILGTDTITISNQNQNDHVVLHLGNDGSLAGQLIVPGTPTTGVFCNALAASIDGRCYWVGRSWPGATVNGITINNSSFGRGLFMELNAAVVPTEVLSLMGGPSVLTAIDLDEPSGELAIGGSAYGDIDLMGSPFQGVAFDYAFITTRSSAGEFRPITGLAYSMGVSGPGCYVMAIRHRWGITHALGTTGYSSRRWNGSQLHAGQFLSRVQSAETVGITDPQYNEVGCSVWPNPVEAVLSVMINDGTSGRASLSILSIDGRVVHQEESRAGANDLQVDCSRLKAGQYFLQVKAAEWTRTVPFIRQ